jgi:hypothetical protein
MAEKQNVVTETEELQKEVLQASLRTQKAILAREEAALEETLEALADRKQKKETAKRTNENRQAQLAIDRANQRHLQQNVCQHRSGGYMGQTPITEGGGTNSFSVLHVTILGHDKIKFIQCGRCPLKLWIVDTPAEEKRLQAAAAKAKPGSKEAMAWEDYLWGKELLATHKKTSLPNSTSKGATFNFEKNGVPFIPKVPGWVTSGPRPA